jgi:hypothetical protein
VLPPSPPPSSPPPPATRYPTLARSTATPWPRRYFRIDAQRRIKGRRLVAPRKMRTCIPSTAVCGGKGCVKNIRMPGSPSRMSPGLMNKSIHLRASPFNVNTLRLAREKGASRVYEEERVREGESELPAWASEGTKREAFSSNSSSSSSSSSSSNRKGRKNGTSSRTRRNVKGTRDPTRYNRN